MDDAQELIRSVRAGILMWRKFQNGSVILNVGEVKDFILKETDVSDLHVSNLPITAISEVMEEGIYDYILCIGALESVREPEVCLAKFRRLLKSDGVLLLGLHNRFGIRYFCGDRDPYTGRNFDGIEDYWRAYNKAEDGFTGRMFDRAGIEHMLEVTGFTKRKFYSVFPGLENPSFLFADGYVPNEDLCGRIFPAYHSPDTIFLEEERLYQGLTENGLFHKIANAFLVECPLAGECSDVLQVTNSLDRGRQDALITVLHESGTVTKQAAYKEGEERLKSLLQNAEKLKKHGIAVVEAELSDGVYTMPLIKAETGQLYLEKLLRTDTEQFLRKMDEFRALILSSSDSFESVYEKPIPPDETEEEQKKRLKKRKEPWEKEPTLLLKEAMLDMVPLNSFYIAGQFVFFDQEFLIENYPANVLVTRMIATFYAGDPAAEKIYPRKKMFQRYGLPDGIHGEDRNRWLSMEWEFLAKLRKEKELAGYYGKVRCNPETVNANRQRMNFSADDYQRLFVDIFEYADTRKLILFGSGAFARRFLALYGEDYPVYAVVDNNVGRWGKKLYPEGSAETGDASNGVEIFAPSLLKEMGHGEYKILICIKNYLSVMRQMEDMGIKEYAIFDAGKAYQRKRHPVPLPQEDPKKYHVGYIAGVFDLYHIGHLNMFRRAKGMCDYLIVGVVSDEGVRRFKNVNPFVPFEERIEMVRSCRYVDEAVEIPFMFGSTEDAWRLHHFDVQFSGSDYVNDPEWKKNKVFLEKHGATLEFFPYTQATSSTKLKELIERKLL